ncbi:MAG: DUF3368 domain-containing protein [Candidatus Aenigmatarchaeota archaeon]
MKLVFDSTPLIYFGRISILDKITKLKDEKIIPFSVYKEVVETGLRKGKEDAYLVKSLVNQGLFSVEKGQDKIMKEFNEIRRLSMADAETLAVAKNKKAIAIIDESFLRTIAEAHGIEYAGSIFILFKLYKEKLIEKKDIKKYLDEMIRHKWRCSTELYASILEKIGEL